MYAIDPAVSGGGFHLRYEGAAGVTLSDDPQLLAVNLARRVDSPALTGHYLVDMLPQPDLPSIEEHFVNRFFLSLEWRPPSRGMSSASPAPHC